MTLYSYVVARDYGFAPNPFFGVCTLATCKPLIRRAAQAGDWVVGTGSKGYNLDGRVVFAMKVTETLTFDEYWSDARFRSKRANLNGSLKQAFGDNIYHRNRKTGRWIQVDSHHSHQDGTPNPGNVKHDTQAPRVLISTEFCYWGAKGPKIPVRFRNFKGTDICAHRGHKNRFPDGMAEAFVAWLQERGETGFISPPAEF